MKIYCNTKDQEILKNYELNANPLFKSRNARKKKELEGSITTTGATQTSFIGSPLKKNTRHNRTQSFDKYNASHHTQDKFESQNLHPSTSSSNHKKQGSHSGSLSSGKSSKSQNNTQQQAKFTPSMARVFLRAKIPKGQSRHINNNLLGIPGNSHTTHYTSSTHDSLHSSNPRTHTNTALKQTNCSAHSYLSSALSTQAFPTHASTHGYTHGFTHGSTQGSTHASTHGSTHAHPLQKDNIFNKKSIFSDNAHHYISAHVNSNVGKKNYEFKQVALPGNAGNAGQGVVKGSGNIRKGKYVNKTAAVSRSPTNRKPKRKTQAQSFISTRSGSVEPNELLQKDKNNFSFSYYSNKPKRSNTNTLHNRTPVIQIKHKNQNNSKFQMIYYVPN